MAVIRRTFELIKGIFRRSYSRVEGVQNCSGRSIVSQGEQDSGLIPYGLERETNEKSGTWFEQIDGSKKRRLADVTEEHARKRGRTDRDRFSNDSAYASGRVDGIYDPKNVLHTDQRTDRDLMPPPTTRLIRQEPIDSRNGRRRESLESFEEYSDARSHRMRAADFENEYDMESARRRAAATQLPPNSGKWEPAEKELFFHLAYRGFEPLLSNTWMTDFPTLPISLFAVHSDQIPLIRSHKSTEFRAIKALRELVDTGKYVRDRTLAGGTGLRSEPIIEKAAKRYIKWSLTDIGISSKQCIPVHTIVAMKQGQTTRDTVRELTLKMHKLSARHREECDILTSIEQEEINSRVSNDKTQMSEAPAESEHKLPVIYGFMICSSLIAIFTLSSHTPPPAFILRTQKNNVHPRPDTDKETKRSGEEPPQGIIDVDDEDEDSGLRFISSFDFSNSTTDVWNAFVIAIVAMMIRKSLIDVYEVPIIDERLEEEGSLLEDSSLMDEFGIGYDRYTARYAIGQDS